MIEEEADGGAGDGDDEDEEEPHQDAAAGLPAGVGITQVAVQVSCNWCSLLVDV
jgi:hypothetical protein